MAAPSTNETWIIEVGDDVIHKMARFGDDSLSPWQQLVYCVWVADYGIRNAGDLRAAQDVYPEFKEEAERLADDLSLSFTRETFALDQKTLELEYYSRFERICDEIKGAEPAAAANAGQRHAGC